VIWEYTFRRRKVSDVDVRFRMAADVLPILQAEYDGLDHEELIVFVLDTRNRVMGHHRVYVGNVAGSSLRVGECFAAAIRLNAASVIVAHNHPSGDPSPSGDDLRVTQDLAEAGRLLDIELLDHIVVGEGDRYVSLRQAGQIG
jgi:DNA repair protein RadC